MRISRFRAISIFVFCALAALLTTLLASTASAQSRNAPASPPAAGESAKPALSPMEQVASLQARMWRDFFGRKYDDAIVLSDDIVQMLSSLQRQPNANKAALERARLEAGHCLARAHWAQGTPASREQAKKLWAAIGKNTEISSNVQRQSIADALQAQADGKADVALKLLEGVVKRNLPDTCTAEAAIELSRLYAAAQRFGDAEKMLKAVAAFMDKCGKNGEIDRKSVV